VAAAIVPWPDALPVRYTESRPKALFQAKTIASHFTFFSRRSLRSILRGAYSYLFGEHGHRRVHGWKLFYRLRLAVLLYSPKPFQEVGRLDRPKLWVDKEAFPRIFRLLRRAKHTVVIQMFIWKDDVLGKRMVHELLQIADRGVRIEIFKETVGDFFETNRDFVTTRASDDPLWKRFWKHKNIKITLEAHNDHAKVFIIDDTIFLLTGMNIADEYDEEWHDYMVELRGRHFIEHYLTHGEVQSPGAAERLVLNVDHRKEIRPVVMELIAEARETIVIEHCYFSDQRIVDALVERSNDGVRITVIVPAEPDLHHNANQQAIARLLEKANRRRLQVFHYPRNVHGKIMLIDKETAFVGSANFMASSLDSMGEVNVLLRGETSPAILKLRRILRDDVLQSEPVHTPPSLSWYRRWLAWFKL
jgi:cardiolipin synthase A/B